MEENMIQIETITNEKEDEFVSDINYFLEKMQEYQFVDIKYQIKSDKEHLLYSAMIIYKVD